MNGCSERRGSQLTAPSARREIGAMAIQTFSLAIVAANDVLGWDRREELVEYRERVKRLSSEFYDRVSRGSAKQGTEEGA